MAAVTKLMQYTNDAGIIVYNLNTGKTHKFPIVTTYSESGWYAEADAITAVDSAAAITVSGGAVTKAVATASRVGETARFVVQTTGETTGPWTEVTEP